MGKKKNEGFLYPNNRSFTKRCAPRQKVYRKTLAAQRRRTKIREKGRKLKLVDKKKAKEKKGKKKKEKERRKKKRRWNEPICII